MIVLVCGGRTYRDFETVAAILDDKRSDIQALVHGDAAQRAEAADLGAQDARRPQAPALLLEAEQERPDVPAKARTARAKRTPKKRG